MGCCAAAGAASASAPNATRAIRARTVVRFIAPPRAASPSQRKSCARSTR